MKRIRKIILLFSIMFALASCNASKAETSKGRVINDREGNEITLPTKIEKIISTAPSFTEILCDIGLENNIIAVDSYSMDLGILNEDIPTIDMMNPEIETIISLEPDVIFVSSMSREGGSSDPYKPLSDLGICIIYIPHPESIDGIKQDIAFFGDVLSKDKETKSLIANMESRISEITAIIAEKGLSKRVFFELGDYEGLITFGSNVFLDEMLSIAGGENVFKELSGWVTVSEEVVLEKNPEIILTNVNYIDNYNEVILARESWQNIEAVKNREVYQLDSNNTSLSNHNIVKGIEEMAKLISPEISFD